MTYTIASDAPERLGGEPAPAALPGARIDIVVPVYNEQAALEDSIRRLHAFLSRRAALRLADRHRRQRQHRRHAGDRPRAGLRARPRHGAAPRAQGPRPGAARGLVGERRRRALLHGRRPLDRPAGAAAAGLGAGLAATARWRSAAGWRRARAWSAGRKRELISRSYNRLLRLVLRRALLRRPVRVQGDPGRRRPPPAAADRRTRAGSSTPSCWSWPSAAGCASTRWPSTGSTTPTPGSTSSPPR